MEDRLTLEQAAKRLGLKMQTVRLWIKQGKIPASKPLGRWLINVDVIGKLLQEGLTKQQPTVIQPVKYNSLPQQQPEPCITKTKLLEEEIRELKLVIEQKNIKLKDLHLVIGDKETKIERLQELLEVRDEELRQARGMS